MDTCKKIVPLLLIPAARKLHCKRGLPPISARLLPERTSVLKAAKARGVQDLDCNRPQPAITAGRDIAQWLNGRRDNDPL
jgi:hypothetical protein